MVRVFDRLEWKEGITAYSEIVVVIAFVIVQRSVKLIENGFLDTGIQIRIFEVVVLLFLLLQDVQLSMKQATITHSLEFFVIEQRFQNLLLFFVIIRHTGLLLFSSIHGTYIELANRLRLLVQN